MDSIFNIAHRGARSLAPENTLAAARKALDCGAAMWEIDVALTADGVPYLVHDDTLARTSNVAAIFPERRPWSSHAFTLAEIRQLDFGSWFNERDPFGQIAAGTVSGADQAGYVGEPAPTLEEALRLTRDHGWRVNVEIKDLCGTPGEANIVERVVSLIEKMGLVEAVILSSFNQAYLRRAKVCCPSLPTGLLVKILLPDPLSCLRELKAQAFHPQDGLYAPDHLAEVRAAGFAVNVWTVNDAARMMRLAEVGVSGIITDFPQRLASLGDSPGEGSD